MFYVNCAKVDQSIQVDWLDGQLCFRCAQQLNDQPGFDLDCSRIQNTVVALGKKYDFEPNICKSKKMKKKLGEMQRHCIIFLLLMFPTCKGLKQNEVKPNRQDNILSVS